MNAKAMMAEGKIRRFNLGREQNSYAALAPTFDEIPFPRIGTWQTRNITQAHHRVFVT